MTLFKKLYKFLAAAQAEDHGSYYRIVINQSGKPEIIIISKMPDNQKKGGKS